MESRRARRTAGTIALLALATASGPRGAAAAGPVSEKDASEIHRRALVVDTHADTLWRVLDQGHDVTVRSSAGHLDIPRLKEGGVDAQFFSVWVSPAHAHRSAWRALRLIDAFHRVAEASGGALAPARTPDDIRAAAASGRVAGLLGIEGGHAIEDDLGLLRMFYTLGVRYMTLTWSFNTDWADSSGDRAEWHGLNDFGVKVVAEMNRLGMLVDVSHVSDETFHDVLKVTRAPVIASHSSCRALCDAPRNMTDDMLRAVRGNGGVVMLNFYSAFLDQQFRDRSRDAAAAFKQRLAGIGARFLLDPVGREDALWALHAEVDASVPPPPLQRLIDHIEHVIRIAGVDHVGLGSDFDGVTSLPAGLEDVSKLPAVTRLLLERGHAESDVAKVLGGNFMRVFDEVVRRSETKGR